MKRLPFVNYMKSLLVKPERSNVNQRRRRNDRQFALEGLENRTLLTVNLVETEVVESDLFSADGSFGADGNHRL